MAPIPAGTGVCGVVGLRSGSSLLGFSADCGQARGPGAGGRGGGEGRGPRSRFPRRGHWVSRARRLRWFKGLGSTCRLRWFRVWVVRAGYGGLGSGWCVLATVV